MEHDLGDCRVHHSFGSSISPYLIEVFVLSVHDGFSLSIPDFAKGIGSIIN
jgi:hypothetical protein